MLVVFLMLNSVYTVGQTPSYEFISYGVEEGLPSSEVYCILEDSKGFMWFGTDGGISKYNGYEFENYTVKDGLLENTIFHLFEDPKGRVWYSSFSNGLGFIENGQFLPYRYNDTLLTYLKGRHIIQLLFNSDGSMRFNTVNFGSGRIDKNGELTYQTGHKIGKNEIIIQNKSEHFNAFYLRDPKHNSVVSATKLSQIIISDDSDKDTTINVNAVISIRSKIFLGNNNGLYFLYGNHNRMCLGYIYDSQVITRDFSPEATQIFEDSKGRIWVGYRNNGIEIFRNKADLFRSRKPILKLFNEVNVSDIHEDVTGGLWISLENYGVYFIPNTNLVKYNNQTILDNKITSISNLKNSSIFYSTDAGNIYEMKDDGRHLLFYTMPDVITRIVVKDSLNLYLTHENKRFGKAMTKSINNSHQIHHYNGRYFTIGHNDNILYVEGIDFKEITGDSIIFSALLNGKPEFYYTIFEAYNGDIWLGGKNGLFVYRNRTLKNVPIFGKDTYIVRSINQLTDSTLLVSTDVSGLLFLRKTDSILKPIHTELKNEFINHLHIADDATIWASTNNGIFKLQGNVESGYSVQRINRAHGLTNNEVNQILTINNDVYVATNSGLTKFDQSAVIPNRVPTPLYTESIKVNEKVTPIKEDISLNYFENSIEFSYIAISYRAKGNIVYKYRLAGLEKEWQYTVSRKIRYPSLQPGNYTFMVSSQNEDGVWSDIQSISLSISYPYWKQWWFIIGIIILVFASVYLMIYQITKRKAQRRESARQIERQKRKIIEAELKALRSQMNPHFTFNVLNAIQNTITAFNPDKTAKYLSKFSLLLRKILENSKHSMILLEDEIEMLKLYIELENIRFESPINYSFEIDPQINIGFQKIPSMVIQPIVENAILHGLSDKKRQNKKIKIEVLIEDNVLKCIVEDNGVGRKKAKEISERKNLNQESLGIQITTDRLNLINQDQETNVTIDVVDLYDDVNTPLGTKVIILLLNLRKHYL